MWRAALVLGAILSQAPSLASRIPVFAAPSRQPAPPTPTELAALRAGVALHNQQRFDEALAQFDAVLKESPDNIQAIYEGAYSLYERHDYERAFDRAVHCTEYVAPVLAQCYSLLGGILEASNASAQAIDVYKKGLEFVPSALLYYNMASTYQNGLKNSPAAKEALKKAAFLDPNHASTQLMLGRLLQSGGYRTLALAAFSRFLVLEPATPRTPQAFNAWMSVLSGGVTQSADGKTQVAVNPNTPTDEGKLATLDLFISFSRTSALAQRGGKNQAQVLVDQFTQLLEHDVFTGPGDDASTFLWTYYMPYFAAMLESHMVEPFVYHVSRSTNLGGVREWLGDPANQQRLQDFVKWSAQYPWPKPR